MTQSELTQQLMQQTGVGVAKFDFLQLLTWGADSDSPQVRGFAYAMRWGVRTLRFSMATETAIARMTPYELVEFMADVIANCDNNLQAMVNYVNSKFRTY